MFKLVAKSVNSCPGARFASFDILFLTYKPISPTPNTLASNSLPYWKNLSRDIICLSMYMTAGYTSRTVKVSMDYPRTVCSPTSSSKLASAQRGTTRLPPPLAFGATNSAPFSLSSLLTILVYNTLTIAISTTCAMSSSHTTPSPNIGKATNISALILNGITSNERAASP